jgi:hypothetical protein
MTDITAARANIQTEETDYNSAVSESVLQKVGGSINFINDRQNKAYDFKFLGPFRPISGGEDGVRSVVFDIQIVAISGYIRLSGSSGTTTVDLHSITGSTDNGSILDTKLSITSAATDGIAFYTNYLDASSSGGTGITLPTFAAATNRNLSQGDALRIDLDDNATSAYDLSINIHYRPR